MGVHLSTAKWGSITITNKGVHLWGSASHARMGSHGAQAGAGERKVGGIAA
jgi:hypothetical protein